MKIGDVKTGKALQKYKDGSFYDGFMLNDELAKGRFFFTNGDKFTGTYKDGQVSQGMYVMAGEPKAEMKQDTKITDGKIEGKVHQLQINIASDQQVSLTSDFKNGRPEGQIKLKLNGKDITIESPWENGALKAGFSSAQASAPEPSAPQQSAPEKSAPEPSSEQPADPPKEEEKKEEKAAESTTAVSSVVDDAVAKKDQEIKDLQEQLKQ